MEILSKLFSYLGGSEVADFKNIRNIHILEPWYVYESLRTNHWKRC